MANLGSLVARLGVDSSDLRMADTRMRQFTRNAESSLEKVKRSVFNLKNAFIAMATVAGATYLIRRISVPFIDAARTVENLRVRLKALLGDVKEGNRLFEDLARFAGRVPFQLEEIMDSATMLAGIMKGGVDQIMSWMPLIGDLAAVTGLGIQKTTEQVMRMLSAGAASADLFRERGVLAMLGFQGGVRYTAAETAKILIDSWMKINSQFRGATADLAKTWDGIVSMLQDAWFRFRRAIMETIPGVFEWLKGGLNSIRALIERMEAEGTFRRWGESLGRAVQKIEWQTIINTMWELIQLARLAYKTIRFIVQGYINLWIWADRLLRLTQGAKAQAEYGKAVERQQLLARTMMKTEAELNALRENYERAREAGQNRIADLLENEISLRTTLMETLRREYDLTIQKLAELEGKWREVQAPMLPELEEIKIAPRLAMPPITTGLGAGAEEAGEVTDKVEEYTAALDNAFVKGAMIRSQWMAMPEAMRELVPRMEQQNQFMIDLEEGTKNIARGFEEGIGNALGQAAVSGERFGDIMKGALRGIAAEAVALTAKLLILKPLIEGIMGGAAGGPFGFIGGIIKGILPFKTGGFIERAQAGLMIPRIAPDERLIIGHAGEAVLPESVVSGLGRGVVAKMIQGDFRGLGGDREISISMQNYFGDVRSDMDLKEAALVLAEGVRTALREA